VAGRTTCGAGDAYVGGGGGGGAAAGAFSSCVGAGTGTGGVVYVCGGSESSTSKTSFSAAKQRDNVLYSAVEITTIENTLQHLFENISCSLS
jgi:hypothetical protein